MATVNGTKERRAAERAAKTLLASLPKRLAFVRGDLSQRAMAEKLGIFQQNQNRYEHGTSPHLEYLERLHVVHGVNLNWLVTGKGTPFVGPS